MCTHVLHFSGFLGSFFHGPNDGQTNRTANIAYKGFIRGINCNDGSHFGVV